MTKAEKAKREYLYVVAMEECAELAKELSKCFRFGGNSTDTGEYVNKDRAAFEYYDLIAVIEMLYAAGGLPEYEQEEIVAMKEEKKQKVERYWSERNEFG